MTTHHPTVSAAELLARYAAGERFFGEMELDVPGMDMTGVVLDGIDFSGSFFDTSFRNASLRGARFCRSNVKCCDFSGADLTDADFTGAALEATEWEGAVLTRTRFGDVSLYGAHLTETQFLELIVPSEPGT